LSRVWGSCDSHQFAVGPENAGANALGAPVDPDHKLLFSVGSTAAQAQRRRQPPPGEPAKADEIMSARSCGVAAINHGRYQRQL
jgi:hypothetical protein